MGRTAAYSCMLTCTIDLHNIGRCILLLLGLEQVGKGNSFERWSFTVRLSCGLILNVENRTYFATIT